MTTRTIGLTTVPVQVVVFVMPSSGCVVVSHWVNLSRSCAAVGPSVSSRSSAAITSKVNVFVCFRPSLSPLMVTVMFVPTLFSDGITISSATCPRVIA